MRDRYKGLSIECAAIRLADGEVVSIARPGRHCDILRQIKEAGLPKPINCEQGFLLNDGRFVRRVPAKHIAREAGQLLPHVLPLRELYSEDVW